MELFLNRLRNPRNMAAVAITAALYVALTFILAPVGFSMVQFRFSETLCLLAFIDPIYGVGITLGCFFANLASPYGMLDVLVGTLATLLAVWRMAKSKSLLTASLWPTFFSLLTAGMISFMTGVGFLVTAAYLCFSEFVVVTLIGCPLFGLLLKNPRISTLLNLKTNMHGTLH